VLVGNGPIRASDPSGAVINRRRSLIVPGVVAASEERRLLDPDGSGGWRGELADELPGLVNWALVMTPAEARAALSRDVCSLARVEMELETLLNTDLLADWADQHLIWDPLNTARVGAADGDADLFLFPSYLRWMDQQGRNSRPLSLKVFKAKLVDLLRDTLGLAMPGGTVTAGDYRQRGLGSVVPCLRFRQDGEEELPGVIRHAVMAEASGTDEAPSGTDAERIGNGKTPVGNGWNGWNGSDQISHKEKNADPPDPLPDAPVISLMGGETSGTVPAVPSVPRKGFDVSPSVPEPVPSVPPGVPVEVQNPQTGNWESGWRQLTSGSGSGSVLCSDPSGNSRQVDRKRIRQALQREAA
jgi:hypothetical protein